MTKPFSPRELVLRVQSVLRRARAGAPAPAARRWSTATWSSTSARRVARRGGEPLALTVREFDLLVFLMRNPGRAFTPRASC